jgi:hypothetical protein
MRDWFYMELNSGYAFEEALGVCDYVFQGVQYGTLTKSEFLAKKGQVCRRMARTHLYIDSDRCLRDFQSAVRYYLEAITLSAQRGVDASKAIAWVEDAFAELVNAAARYQLWPTVLDFVKNEMAGKHALTPIVPQLTQFIQGSPSDRRKQSAAMRGALTSFRARLLGKGVNSLTSEEKKILADTIDLALQNLN